MSAEQGFASPEPSPPRGAERFAAAPRPLAEQAERRTLLTEHDPFERILQAKERELRERLTREKTRGNECQETLADLESIAWLRQHGSEIQHDARCLLDFPDWLRTPPGRAQLFANFCRRAAPSAWDRWAAIGEPPRPFASQERLLADVQERAHDRDGRVVGNLRLGGGSPREILARHRQRRGFCLFDHFRSAAARPRGGAPS